MSNETSADLSRLQALLGLDLGGLEARVAAIQESFSDLESKAPVELSLPPASSYQEKTVFLCARIEVSAALLDHLARLRCLVREHVRDADSVYFTDPRDQHCTIFVLHRSEAMLNSEAFAKCTLRVTPLLNVRPFTLYFSRPLFTVDGGLILKGETFSDSLFSMRQNLNPEYDPRSDIVHTTFGYIRSISLSAITALRNRMRSLDDLKVSFRVRELRIAMAVGFKIVQWSEALPLAEQPNFDENDAALACNLERCSAVVGSAPISRALKSILREEAFYRLEYPLGPLSQQAAERLIRFLAE